MPREKLKLLDQGDGDKAAVETKLKPFAERIMGRRSVTTRTIIDDGQDLREAKNLAKHGTWEPFLKSIEMTKQTALRRMWLADGWDFAEGLGDDKSNIMLRIGPTALEVLCEPGVLNDALPRALKLDYAPTVAQAMVIAGKEPKHRKVPSIESAAKFLAEHFDAREIDEIATAAIQLLKKEAA